MRNGNTWFITANEPLSYEPAGSRVVTLSVVPMVRAPAAEVLPPSPPPSSLEPEQAVRTRAVAARPAVAARTRRRCGAREVMRCLFCQGRGRVNRARRLFLSGLWVAHRCVTHDEGLTEK